MTRTRFWCDPMWLSSTCVQFRADTKPMVWLHTNIGWIPVGNTPETEKEAESFAIGLAEGYNLTEANQGLAQYMLRETE